MASRALEQNALAIRCTDTILHTTTFSLAVLLSSLFESYEYPLPTLYHLNFLSNTALELNTKRTLLPVRHRRQQRPQQPRHLFRRQQHQGITPHQANLALSSLSECSARNYGFWRYEIAGREKRGSLRAVLSILLALNLARG